MPRPHLHAVPLRPAADDARESPPQQPADGSRRTVTVLGTLDCGPAFRAGSGSRRLVALLAVHAPVPLPRALAADQLWPDRPGEAARAGLRQALWQLPPGWVSSRGEELVLEADVDLVAAKALALRLLGDPATLLPQDVELLGQDVLPGWYDDWALYAREAFHVLRLGALEHAARGALGRDDPPSALLAAATAVRCEPLRESAQALLIRAHLAAGNRYDAVRAYQRCAALLDEALGVRADPALTALVGPLLRRVR